MAVIKIMDEHLANKIAAGEVVEKCASVVKELVENSIDANSTDIMIDLIDAGTKEIKVTDNGIGMEKEDAIMSFQRHATSKIKTEDDLYRIETLGFRGEALASIASVSNILLKTSKEETGTIVEINGGTIVNVQSSDSRKGTSISVKNLFYNTPARLKHMNSLYTELANITDYLNKLSLSHPNIRFTLTNNDNVILKTDGTNNLLKTIKNIYGINIAKKMIEVSGETEDYVVEGYISLPEIHRSNRNSMVILVNGRIVRNSELNRTINDAYHSYKPDNRYPVVVLNITVDPSLVDVNIHPTKMDIKFSKIDELCNLIDTIIKNNITNRNLIPKIETPIEPAPLKPKYQEITLNLNRNNEFNTYEEEYIINDNLINEEEAKYEQLEDSKELEELKSNIDEEKEQKEKLPELYPVGLVHGTYIICQNELGMYLIDQHAAKERINYEIYKEKLGNPTNSSVSLLFPITIELSTNEFIILKENIEIMKNMNFNVEEWGINSILIKSHPVWLPKNYEEEAIRKIVDAIIHKEKNFSILKFNESLSIMLSCKMSIKANTNITIEEMENLIDDLRKCTNPFNCPHGRPTIIFYSKYELEKLFKRSGF